MKSFRQWILCEKAKPQEPHGNYVSMNVVNMPSHSYSKSGINVPPEKAHVTLVYSSSTDTPMGVIKRLLVPFNDLDVVAKPSGYAKFDDGDKCAIVLKIKSPKIDDLHQLLIDAGLKHSYDPFYAHVTLAYKVPSDEGDDIIESLNGEEFPPIVLRGFNINPIIDDWAETI